MATIEQALEYGITIKLAYQKRRGRLICMCISVGGICRDIIPAGEQIVIVKRQTFYRNKIAWRIHERWRASCFKQAFELILEKHALAKPYMQPIGRRKREPTTRTILKKAYPERVALMNRWTAAQSRFKKLTITPPKVEGVQDIAKFSNKLSRAIASMYKAYIEMQHLEYPVPASWHTTVDSWQDNTKPCLLVPASTIPG